MSLTRGATGPGNFARHASFGSHASNRPPSANRVSLGNLGGRAGNSGLNASFLDSNGTRKDLGNSGFGGMRAGTGRFPSNRFDGGSSRNASMTRTGANAGFGTGRFGGSRNFEFGSNRSDHSGHGHNHFGYGHFGGFGWSGGGWDDSFHGLWFLGDVFGLALDVARFAIVPAWQVVGADLLGAGIQAVANLGNDNNSYDGYRYNNED